MLKNILTGPMDFTLLQKYFLIYYSENILFTLLNHFFISREETIPIISLYLQSLYLGIFSSSLGGSFGHQSRGSTNLTVALNGSCGPL